MNNKGQALVEFVLILPVFLFIVFAVFDFGMIFSSKNELENDSLDISLLVKNGTTLEEIKTMYPNLSITINNDSEYYEVKISEEINLITPGFNRIFGDPYLIDVSRYVPYA